TNRQPEKLITSMIDDLENLNKLRNKIVHQLWKIGYSGINKLLEEPSCKLVVLYSLHIEFLETFDDEISESGFKVDQ
ncbi:hypothetical protein K8I31_20805, partial [bacterium]|nr:hypothetical protein [bacterium]